MKKIAWLLDRPIGQIDKAEGLWDYFGQVEIFAPLASQPSGQKHRYPDQLTESEMEVALRCDEIFIPRLHEGFKNKLALTLLAKGRKPIMPRFSRIDTQSERNNYCEYQFTGFERIMDDSQKTKTLVPKSREEEVRKNSELYQLEFYEFL